MFGFNLIVRESISNPGIKRDALRCFVRFDGQAANVRQESPDLADRIAGFELLEIDHVARTQPMQVDSSH